MDCAHFQKTLPMTDSPQMTASFCPLQRCRCRCRGWDEAAAVDEEPNHDNDLAAVVVALVVKYIYLAFCCHKIWTLYTNYLKQKIIIKKMPSKNIFLPEKSIKIWSGLRLTKKLVGTETHKEFLSAVVSGRGFGPNLVQADFSRSPPRSKWKDDVLFCPPSHVGLGMVFVLLVALLDQQQASLLQNGTTERNPK